MSLQVTELSDKVVVIQSDRYLEFEEIQLIIKEFRKNGFDVIWLSL
jgi:biopolymer transport protein ExbD